MGRNRIVQQEIVTLPLADVYRRRLAKLETDGVATGEGKFRKATTEEIAQARRALEAAVADGAWITVKSELTAGEQRQANSKLVKTMHFGVRPEVDPEQVGFAKVLAYVTGWSIEDAAGKVPFDESALNGVDSETYAEIEAAVDWHEDQVIAAREARKNGTAGQTKS
jgi:hypothetical protein